jgi:hypothetical protein
MIFDMLLMGPTFLWADLAVRSLIFSDLLVWLKIKVSSMSYIT